MCKALRGYLRFPCKGMEYRRFLWHRGCFYGVESGLDTMKNALLVVMMVFAGSACFGQTAAFLSSQPQVIHMTDHPMQAEQHSMASERPLVGGGPSTYSYARG